MNKNKLSIALLLLILLSAGSASAHAQVVPSAFHNPISLNVGAIGSVFSPDYGPNKLAGFGAFVDLNVFHGIGVEGEGRWLRFNQFENINQDNYLVGPRVKLHPLWRLQPYGKVLGGTSHMIFQDHVFSGHFTTVAFGGGVDIHVRRKWTLRAIDYEYQYWPNFFGTHLSPNGVSAGVSYRIF
ncbi:porin family protein [Acidicapsa ligni]|uniref:porin family protein n=1 Tax=Acidicapsa ligni TaxID=542300 RepID=UPI0021DFEA36|nr:porin family protein [Acidicapsa ligni]